MSETMHVVAAVDDGYAQHLTVMLLSLFEHNLSRNLQVHVIVPEQFSADPKVVAALGHHSHSVTFVRISDLNLQGLIVREDLTVATYYRLLLDRILPPEIKRVIYLDCDIIIRSDLSSLWAVPLEQHAVAAVPDLGFVHHGVLGLADEAPYFNAGVMVINMDRWRRESIGPAALEMAKTEPERLTWGDQCALNWLLQGRWVRLDGAWNVQSCNLERQSNGDLQWFHPSRKSARAARIVHFTAPDKPWFYMVEHPFKSEYLSYLARTPWRNHRPDDKYPHNFVIKTLKRYMPIMLPAYTALRRYI